MEILKKYKVLLVLTLIVMAGVFFFFYRFYYHDVKALKNFTLSYERFDRAISNFSVGETDDLNIKADGALHELTHAASFRLSSLIKNDGLIPPLALEIADFSGKELDALRAYKRLGQSKNSDLDRLAKEYGDLASRRKTAYARFRELAE